MDGLQVLETISQINPSFSFSDFIRYNVQSQQQESFDTFINKPSHNFKTGLAESNIELIFSSAQHVVGLTSQFNIKRKLDEYLYRET